MRCIFYLLISLLSSLGIQAQVAGDSLKASRQSLNLKLETSPAKDVSVTGQETATQPENELADLRETALYDSLWLKTLVETAELYPQMQEMVADAAKDSLVANLADWDSERFKQQLARLDEKTPFNLAYNASLESVIKHYLSRKRVLMQRMLTASQFYFPLFEQHLDKHNLPLEIKYLAIVESALNPRARSRVGATGLWQFMYPTGKMYDLDVSSYVDERRDPIRATEAASLYLNKLFEIFQDWDLALAAYNSGPGNVNKAIRRSGGYKNYWNIRGNLPRETAGYVPAFFATMFVFEYADYYGIKPEGAPRPYLLTDTIRIKETITFEQVSELLKVDKKELEFLNPAYKLNVIPRIKGKDYYLRLPRQKVGAFVANETAIYDFAKQQIAQQEKPLPKLVTAEDRVTYRVRSGDYLGKIAERYGVRVSQIKSWNGLRSNNLRIGQRLTLYPRKPLATSKTPSPPKRSDISLPKDPSKIHIVEQGDSLWTISRKYPGISIENLRKWNGIRGNNLQPGTKLRLCDCSS